ncbi:GNAT family N-acetyltransferase [Plantactinospora solaniradicis]|uniref:GNAT family N-acetyltransferase n=1 Tax=Plantactinospora solaniradicis TaxID=1723736 RepID=A0ABW1K770_9ACTN
MHQPQTHPPQAHPAERIEFRVAGFADLDARTLHDLLKLRVDVFVVEQECAYPELDGRDVEPGARHLWLSRNGVPFAYLRLLSDPGGVERIGRVAVARADRGGGHAGRLMTEALAVVGHRTCVLDAQTRLVDFYARYGFTPTGPEYVEDGIPHVPMRRDPVDRPRVGGSVATEAR